MKESLKSQLDGQKTTLLPKMIEREDSHSDNKKSNVNKNTASSESENANVNADADSYYIIVQKIQIIIRKMIVQQIHRRESNIFHMMMKLNYFSQYVPQTSFPPNMVHSLPTLQFNVMSSRLDPLSCLNIMRSFLCQNLRRFFNIW